MPVQPRSALAQVVVLLGSSRCELQLNGCEEVVAATPVGLCNTGRCNTVALQKVWYNVQILALALLRQLLRVIGPLPPAALFPVNCSEVVSECD